MTKLSPDARDLIDEARSGERPTRGARARVHAKVLAHVGAGAAAGAAAALVASDAKAIAGAAGAAGSGVKAVASTGLVLKWVAVIGVAGTMALGAGIVRDRIGAQEGRPPTPAQQIAAPTPVLGEARPANPAIAAPSAEAVAPAPTSAPVAPLPPPVASAAAPRRGASAPPGSALPTEESALEVEAARLARAQGEIRAGRPGSALEVLDAHGGGANDGVLGQERVAARILALCALGRKDEARAEAQRFLAQFPRSPVAERVRTSCAGDAPN